MAGEVSATEKLRAMLDELGIEWETPEERWNADSITYWKVGDIKWVAFESENDTLWLNCNSITDVTPEQAIAATVGAGTCQGEIDSDYFECKLTTFKCHSCGWSGIVDDGYAGHSFYGTDMPRHCPNCGRRTEEESE